MKNNFKVAVFYGISHGFNDFIAGFLLTMLSLKSTQITLNSWTFLSYSIIAFGGQFFAGLIVDRFKNHKIFTFISLILMFFAILFFYINIYCAIFFSAIASAFIHVCGGAACHTTDAKSSTLAGIFTSPGVVGLIFGSVLAMLKFDYFFAICIPVLVLLFCYYFLKLAEYKNMELVNNEQTYLDAHDFLMLFLFVAIALRSMLWNIVHLIYSNDIEKLIFVGISAGIGKLLGGYFSDKIKIKNFIFITSVISITLLFFGKNYFPVFCLGVSFLQSGVPISIVLMQNYWKYKPAFATGLVLGVAVLIAGLPSYIYNFSEFQHYKTEIFFFGFLLIFNNFIFLKKSNRI